MKFSLNPNYIKASNLFFISAGLGIINFFLSPEILSSQTDIIISVTTIFLIFVIGLAIRFEVSWIKYILLVLIIIGINTLPPVIKEELALHLVNGIITILQVVAQVYATILILIFGKKKRY